MKKNRYSFNDLVENFDLSKFIKYLEKQCKNKITYPPILPKNHPDLIGDLIKSSSIQKISPKKLENDVYENNGDFMDQAMENGNLLNYVHTNFKLEKNYLFAYGEKDPTPWYFFFIISSKINKCFYILLFFQDNEGYQNDYCIKKVKSKDLAIKFVKEEQKKLEKNKFYIKG